MIDFPFCKINLGLHVLRKRSDGYHDIETCFYPIHWTDILEIIPSDKNKFDITGLSIPGESSKNIVLKAYDLIKHDFDLKPVHIHLHKIIPFGAGLGGGSSNGTHALKLLNLIFDLNLSPDKLKSYAMKLGSDCPFFLESTSVLATGRGEILKPISIGLSGLTIVIVKPSFSVSTAEAYSKVYPVEKDRNLSAILSEPLEKWKSNLKNDFEESVCKIYPAIAEIKNKLYGLGAIYSSMSGSGSSVFGFFENKIVLEGQFEDSISWQTKL